MSGTYIYVIRPCRADFMRTITDQEEVIIGEHFSYLKALLQDGRLLMAGPCEDGAFGIVVFRAESDQAAQAVMQNDPAVREKVMNAEMHSFRVSLFAGNAGTK